MLAYCCMYQYVCMHVLTGAQNIDHPMPNPVKNRPRSSTVSKYMHIGVVSLIIYVGVASLIMCVGVVYRCGSVRVGLAGDMMR